MSEKVVLAMARFPNVAVSTEELSFGEGELVSILQKNTGMGDWWLCQAAGKVGLAPANYLEEVTASGSVAVEEEARTDTFAQPPTVKDDEHIYDHIPAQLQIESTDGEEDELPLKRSLASSHSLPSFVTANIRDSISSRVSDPGNGLYDVPRSVLAQTQNSLTQSVDAGRFSYQAPSQEASHIYDELPVHARYLSPGEAQSSIYDTPRRSNGIYQVPTSALAASGTYDVPRSNEPVRSSDDGYFSPKRESVLPLSIEMMTAEDACRRMAHLNEEINRTWDDLVESVYNARWDGAFRDLTAARTIAATQHFDNHLNAFMEFIKGVINSLTQAKGDEANRQKFSNQFAKLHENRVDFLDKLSYLQDGSGDIETAAQDLISNGLGMLQSVRELDILVRAFRSVIFKQAAPDGLTKPGSYVSASLDVRQMRRKPTDALPPTPTSNMSDTEMIKNLEKVKNYSKLISNGRSWGDGGQRTLANQPRSRPWGSHDNLLSSSTQPAPLEVHYVSPVQGLNPYQPYRRYSAGSSGSSAGSPVPTFEGPVRLTEKDRLSVETYTREFVGSLPELIRAVQKLRVCVEEAKNQALHRAMNGGDETAKSQILACCGNVIKVGHCIVMQADTVFRKFDNEPARQAVSYATNSISIVLKQLGSSSKAAVLQYPNLAAISKVGTSVEQVRTHIVALGKLLKGFVSASS